MIGHGVLVRIFRSSRRALAIPIAAIGALVLVQAASADTGLPLLVPGTAVLLASSSTSGSGGGTTATTSATNIFSPAAYSDYKQFGGEPSTVVDHFPFVPNSPFSFGATSTSYKDLVYVSAPQGFVYPRYSTFLKSSDLGMSFRVPHHFPVYGNEVVNGSGGGDSHMAVGPTTHSVFFVDLYGQCVSAQTSRDLGENFTSDLLGCGLNPGALDDRQWVAADESFPGATPPLPNPPVPGGNVTCLSATPVPTCGNVYISFGADTNVVAPTLAMARSLHDGATGTYATDSVCNLFTNSVGDHINTAPTVGAPDSTPTPCPDPADTQLIISGSVIVDQHVTHNVYIPFVRQDTAGNWQLYIAKSTDGATTWTRQLVQNLGPHNPTYIFPNLAIDTAGNLYYDWVQDQGPTAPGGGGETDVYYAFSTTQGSFWSPPIDITPETGDSAVFPWMVAGSPGNLDVTYYKSNTGLNPDVAFVDTNGNPCGTCTTPNPSVWNVYFGNSNNALNTGSNFKRVQISDHPNHIGQICTGGVGCSTGGNRNLLDFYTVDIDHLGAANISYADDDNGFQSTFDRFTRQLSGNSVFTNTSLSSLQQQWPITNHAVTDQTGDVYNVAGLPDGNCPGMDITGVSESRSGTILTVDLTLNGPPTRLDAIACGSAATGGIWGAEFWASAGATGPIPDNYYVAYVDNGIDAPHGEAGTVRAVNLAITSHEFQANSTAAVTLGGTCLPTGTGPSTATGACTLTLTTDLAMQGLKSGAGLYSITGLSLYYLGANNTIPFTTIKPGDSEQADAAPAFDDNGTGQ